MQPDQTLAQVMRAAALRLHELGANVVAIPAGSKGPACGWKQWHTQRQTEQDVCSLPWHGQHHIPAAAGVGIVNGITGIRTFDIDKAESFEPVERLLDELGLPLDYPWVERTGSGKGYHVHIICWEVMPYDDYSGWPGEASVYVGTSRDGTFDRLELRWANCQTIVAPSVHKETGQRYAWLGEPPISPPEMVDIFRIMAAFDNIVQRNESGTRPGHVAHEPRSGSDQKDEIRRRFDMVAYAIKQFGGDARHEGKQVRITGHGGLLIKPEHDVWYLFSGAVGGDCFDLVGRALFGDRWNKRDGSMFRAAVAEAARFAGVDLPTVDYPDKLTRGEPAPRTRPSNGNGKEHASARAQAGQSLSLSKDAKNVQDRQSPELGDLGDNWRSWSGILLEDVVPETVSWLSRGRLARGKLTVIDGDPGLGKSTMVADWVASITRGKPLPDGNANSPAGVVLLSAEDGLADTIRPRLEAAGADLSRVLALTGIHEAESERLPMLPDDLHIIEEAIVKMKAALLVIDPLMAYLSGQVNSFRDQDVRRALAPLTAMAERTGCAVIIIRHLNKATGGNSLYRGGGSIGIVGAARSGLVVGSDPDNPDHRILASSKSNLAQKPVSLAFRLAPTPGTDVAHIEWLGESNHTADAILARPEDDEDRSALEEAKHVLRDLLQHGPRPATEVKAEARAAGISKRTLERAKDALGVTAQKAGFTGPWFWEYPNTAKITEDRQPPDNGDLGHSWRSSTEVVPAEAVGPSRPIKPQSLIDHDRRCLQEMEELLSQGMLARARAVARQISGRKSQDEADTMLEEFQQGTLQV